MKLRQGIMTRGDSPRRKLMKLYFVIGLQIAIDTVMTSYSPQELLILGAIFAKDSNAHALDLVYRPTEYNSR